MNIQDQDFLNENSEYYDAEMSYLVEDILSTISTSMIYEGYSASAIIGFLADSSTQDILEKYLTFDENILLENTISEEYIQEQLEIFDYCIDEGLAGKLLGGAIKLAGRIASKPARMKIAKKLSTSSNPEKTRAAAQRLAQREARKGNVDGYTKTSSPIDGGKPMSGKQSAELLSKAKLSQATQKVKDIATKAKPVLQKVGKGVGIFGLGAAGGYMGAKLAGGGGDGKVGPKIVGPKIVGPKIVGPKSSSSSDGGGGSNSSGGGGSGGSSKPSSGVPKPAPAKPAAKTDMQKWAKANPRLAQAEKLRQQGASRQDINKVLYDKGTAASQGSGQSKMERDAEELRRMTNKSKQRQGQEMGGPEGPGKIDTKAVEADIKAAQEKEKEKLKQKAAEVAKESYEPYDVVLNYLLSEGHADTLDEANYIMLEMDETAIGTIMEQYEDYLLAEEIQEWVNGLVEEGYDLSQYTWDDMIEYYVTQN